MKSAIKWCLAGFQILHSPQVPFLLLSACSEPHSTTGCTDGDGEEPLDCFVVLTKNTQRILTCTKFSSHTAHLWISKLNIQQATESLVFIHELWNSSQWGNQEQTGPKTHGNKMDISICQLLCHHHWGHSLATMARRNFYHTTGFWSDNNNNKFYCKNSKRVFRKPSNTIFCPKPNPPTLFSFSLKMWLIPPAGQWCRLNIRKNTSDLSSSRTAAAQKLQLLPPTSSFPSKGRRKGFCISPQPWKAWCHHWAFAEQTLCQEVSACELLLVFRPGSDGLCTTTSWAQTSCLSVFSKHLAPVPVL